MYTPSFKKLFKSNIKKTQKKKIGTKLIKKIPYNPKYDIKKKPETILNKKNIRKKRKKFSITKMP
jgi:hypothetical protein